MSQLAWGRGDSLLSVWTVWLTRIIKRREAVEVCPLPLPIVILGKKGQPRQPSALGRVINDGFSSGVWQLVLRINAIYEARRGKKRVKRLSQSTESNSGKGRLLWPTLLLTRI